MKFSYVNFDKFKCRLLYLYFKRKYISHLIRKYFALNHTIVFKIYINVLKFTFHPLNLEAPPTPTPLYFSLKKQNTCAFHSDQFVFLYYFVTSKEFFYFLKYFKKYLKNKFFL